MFLENFFAKIIRWSFLLLFFLTPLIFVPLNYELFEFNKMILVYGMTTIIVGAWIAKMIVLGEIKIAKTPLDMPILLYLISNILSTIYSIDRHTSIWGYYSRFNGGLLSTICYILLYYAFVSNINKIQNSESRIQNNKNSSIINSKLILNSKFLILNSLLISAFLVTFYGILEHFGIDAKYWVQDVKNRVFSTLGQPNWLGAFIDAIIFIPLGLALGRNSKHQAPNNKWFDKLTILSKAEGQSGIFYFIYSIFFLCLVFTNSKSAILAFFAGLLVFSLVIGFTVSEKRKQIGLICLISLIGYLVLGGRTYSYLKKAPLWLKIFTAEQTVTAPAAQVVNGYTLYISESSDIRKVVWKGAINIWKHYPVFGSGVETFAYAYYNFRPPEHNLLSEWDFLYNKAHNEFLNVLATTGTVGIITYLLLILWFLVFSIKYIVYGKKELNNTLNTKYQILNTAFLSGYLTILITSFFGFSVVMIGLLFFMIPAFIFSLTGEISEKNSYHLRFSRPIVQTNIRYLLLIIPFLFIIHYSLFIIKIWRADYYFNRGEKYADANYLVNGLIDLQKAVSLSPSEPMFHNQLALVSAKMAANYKQLEASESAELINQLKNLAVSEAQNTLLLNKVHLNFYKTQARTYIYLASLDPAFKNKAVEIMEKAGYLAPTDAKTFYTLGLLYENVGDLAQAMEVWERTVALKPDYREARISLANLYKQLKLKEQAREQLIYILEKIDNNDKIVKELLLKI